MSHVPDYEIRLLCQQGMVTDYLDKFIRPHSLDFRIKGDSILIEKEPVDPEWYKEAIALQQLNVACGQTEPHPEYVKLRKAIANNTFQRIDISRTTQWNPWVMAPKDFLLGATLECLNLPKGVTADIVLCSTSARKGLNHSLAGHVDGGYLGNPTIELFNVLQWHPVEIWAGMRVGQFIFDSNDEPDRSYVESSGNYYGDREPMEAKQ